MSSERSSSGINMDELAALVKPEPQAGFSGFGQPLSAFPQLQWPQMPGYQPLPPLGQPLPPLGHFGLMEQLNAANTASPGSSLPSLSPAENAAASSSAFQPVAAAQPLLLQQAMAYYQASQQQQQLLQMMMQPQPPQLLLQQHHLAELQQPATLQRLQAIAPPNQRVPSVSSIAEKAHTEKDHDSGNETGSLSPGTSASPNSLASRSNSFSNTITKPVISKNQPAEPKQQPEETKPVKQIPPPAEALPDLKPQLPQIMENPPVPIPQQPAMDFNSLMAAPPQMPYQSAFSVLNAYNQMGIQQMINMSSQNPLEMINPQLAALLTQSGREMCAVCMDKASGYHYSVLSCEGCKGFFRRSVQKDMNYICARNGTCPVDRGSRNRCQKCRYDKCVAAGMNRETVRADKNRKRKANDSDDGRLKEHKKIISLCRQVHDWYKDAWPLDRKLESIEQLKATVREFAKRVATDLSAKELDFIAEKTYKPLAIARIAHISWQKAAILELFDFETAAQVAARAELYRQNFAAELKIDEQIHLISAIIICKSNIPKLEAMDDELASALYNQLYEDKSDRFYIDDLDVIRKNIRSLLD